MHQYYAIKEVHSRYIPYNAKVSLWKRFAITQSVSNSLENFRRHGRPMQRSSHVDTKLIDPQHVHSHVLTTSMDRLIEEFETASSVRGFHIYQKIWSPFLGEVLTCRKEDNRSGRYAVAVCKVDETVGHVPRNISIVCSKFITHGGAIYCKVTGGR